MSDQEKAESEVVVRVLDEDGNEVTGMEADAVAAAVLENLGAAKKREDVGVTFGSVREMREWELARSKGIWIEPPFLPGYRFKIASLESAAKAISEATEAYRVRSGIGPEAEISKEAFMEMLRQVMPGRVVKGWGGKASEEFGAYSHQACLNLLTADGGSLGRIGDWIVEAAKNEQQLHRTWIGAAAKN